MPGSRLTEKQKRFCAEYLIDLNGTQAAIRAGYSARTANEQAARLLANVSVQGHLLGLQKKRSQRTQVTADRVIKELARIAFSDLTEVAAFTNSGMVLADSKQLPKRVTAAIESVSFTETMSEAGPTTKKSVKMHSKLNALRALAEHLGMFKPEKVSVQDDLIKIFEAPLPNDPD